MRLRFLNGNVTHKGKKYVSLRSEVHVVRNKWEVKDMVPVFKYSTGNSILFTLEILPQFFRRKKRFILEVTCDSACLIILCDTFDKATK